MSGRDLSVGLAGLAATLWNFVAQGYLNTLIAAAVGILTIVVLLQRYRINRRELRRTESARSVDDWS